MIKSILAAPFKVGARALDVATGQSRVDVDTTYKVDGNSAKDFVDAFEKDPSKISPISSGARREGEVMLGKPFPLGPEIGIVIDKKTERLLEGGRREVVLDVNYQGAFEGPGRITVRENRDGTLTVRDEWNDVANNSFLPTVFAETGHPLVAGLGFSKIASDIAGRSASFAKDVASTMVTGSFAMMTLPFRFLRRD